MTPIRPSRRKTPHRDQKRRWRAAAAFSVPSAPRKIKAGGLRDVRGLLRLLVSEGDPNFLVPSDPAKMTPPPRKT
jgi:hypothetical protein